MHQSTASALLAAPALIAGCATARRDRNTPLPAMANDEFLLKLVQA